MSQLTSVSNNKFNEIIETLTERDRKAAGELLNGSITHHFLYVSRQDDTVADLLSMDNIPYIQYKFIEPEQLYSGFDDHPNAPIGIRIGPNEKNKLVLHQGAHTKYIIRHIDGSKTLGEILDYARKDIINAGEVVDETGLLDDYQVLYSDLDEWDMILLRDRRIPHFNRSDEL